MKTTGWNRFLAFLLTLSLLLNLLVVIPFTAFAGGQATEVPTTNENLTSEQKHAYEPFKSIKEYQYAEDADQIDEGSLLLKIAADTAPALSPIPEELAALGVALIRTTVDASTPEAMETLGVTKPYKWVMVGLKDVKATEIALSFAEIPYVVDAEYNYIRQTNGKLDESTNPLTSNQWYLDGTLQSAWDYLDEKDYRKNLEDIVVAIIDTGVDYRHPNLVDSMWVNVDEVPGNGIDDDGNGYVDDVYGVSTIGNIWDANGDPMDEMGHGTHVAGIIGATADKMGMAGVAYGVKLMAIKAGSGFFNDSDIIEAIQYAVANGADVINMSFGGYSRSAAIEDALALAYTSSVLVAAAGNDGLDASLSPIYPASYNYVIGVMASDATGAITGFSNTDRVRRNSVEYEIMAPGASIFSTLPDNRYASWSGTSMASPYVSAVAALLRAKYNDKSTYSTRFIMGQIVGTAKMASMGLYGYHSIGIDAYAALTEIPEPDVSYYDYYVFDDPSISEKNNGDGIIDAGETIHLGVLVRNHWGQARNTRVKLIAAANPVDAVLNPYVTWHKDTVEYGDIGTYMTNSNGFIYDPEDSSIIGISDPFIFTVSDKAPNDSYLTFSVVIDCESYEEDDSTNHYHFQNDSFTAMVRHGVELPRRISSDMVLKADTYYILSGSTLIESGVTVTAEPGTQIQFWGDYSKELYAGQDVAKLLVDGELILKGTVDNPIELFPSPSMSDLEVAIDIREAGGRIELQYCNIANPRIRATEVDHCYFTQLQFDYMCSMYKDMDGRWYHNLVTPFVSAKTVTNSIFYELGYRYSYYDFRFEISGNIKGNLFDSCGLNFSSWNISSYEDNVFLRNFRLVNFQINDREYLTSEFNLSSQYNKNNQLRPAFPVKNPETGSTYFFLSVNSYAIAEEFAKRLGGHVLQINDANEMNFVLEYAKRYYAYNADLSDYGLSSRIWKMYIGFYNKDGNVIYQGDGDEADWIRFTENMVVPYIYTSYSTNNNGVVTNRDAWITTEYYSSVDQFTNINPSLAGQSNVGVLIEIPGEITPLELYFDSDALTIPSNTVNYQLITSVFPSIAEYSLTWKSNNESVVTVDENGKITANGLGTTVVTATVAGSDVSAEIVIVVTQYYAPEGLTDSITAISLTKDKETFALTPKVSPDEATAIVLYESSDTSVVMVNSAGVITAVGSGSATVTAKIKDTDFVWTYNVSVAIPPETIQVSSDYVILAMDGIQKKSISYTYAPSYATVGAVQYESTDPAVVTVSEDGTLTPVGEGDAYILLSFPDIQKSYRIRILVVEKSDSIRISHTSTDAERGDYTLYAEDGTTYWLAEYSLIGDSKLPQQLPIKTKQFETLSAWSTWLYIDMEDTLYYVHSSLNHGTKIDENVEKATRLNYNNGMLYLKKDGSVWSYYNNTHTQIGEDFVDMASYGYYVLLLDEHGSVYYIVNPYELQKSEVGPIDLVELDIGEKTIMLSDYSHLVGESGRVYAVHWDMTNELLSGTFEEVITPEQLSTALKITAADIKKTVYVSEMNSYLFLLKDGRVAFAGYKSQGGQYQNLANLLDDIRGNEFGMAILSLDKKVVDIAKGSFVLEDGTVLLYGTKYNSVLGNGKNYETSNRYLTSPVSPWLGLQNDGERIFGESLTVSNNGENKIYNTMPETIEDLMSKTPVLNIKLSKYVNKTQFKNIWFKDLLGNRIEGSASMDVYGKTLTIVPVEELRDGYTYTLTVPAGVLYDEFNNGNSSITFAFTVEGNATYDDVEVPVTGITDTLKNISMKYGETKSLKPSVLPENASVQIVTWSSSDSMVASVNQNGQVTAGKNGTAAITAKTLDGSFVYTYTVTVKTPVESFRLSSQYITLDTATKNTATLSYVLTPSILDGEGVLHWKSADDSIATVDQTGKVTAKAVGITAIYCSSDDVDDVAVCIISVVSDASTIEVQNVFSGYSGAQRFVLQTADAIWLISDDYRVPHKLEINDCKTAYYSSNYDRLILLRTNGILELIDPEDGSTIKVLCDNVKSVVATDYRLVALRNDGTLKQYTIYGDEESLSFNAGVKEIAMRQGRDFFYMILASNSSVLQMRIGNNADPIPFPVPEKVTGFLSADATFVVGESQKLYPLYNVEDTSLQQNWSEENWLRYFYDIQDDILQVVGVCGEYWNLNHYVLLEGGQLAYVGWSYDSNPLAYRYSGFTWEYKGEYLYYIQTEKKVSSIGPYWLIYEDGTVQTFCDSSGYLGDAVHWQNGYHITTPFFVEGEVANALTLVSIKLGDTELSSEITKDAYVADSFRLTYRLPLLPTDMMKLTQVIDSQGNYLECTVTVDGNDLIITPVEPLPAGETYRVVIFAKAVKDVFSNLNERFEFTVRIVEESSVQAYDASKYPTTEYSPDVSIKDLQKQAREFYTELLNNYIAQNSQNVNNAFLNGYANPDATAWMDIRADGNYNGIASLIGNYWGTDKTDLIDRIIYDVKDSFEYGEVVYDPILTTAPETAYPFVTRIVVKNSEGEIVTSVGIEEITVQVSFNRDMDMQVQPKVTYGGEYPYGDFAVEGTWIDARTWVGTTKITAVTGSGMQYFKVRGAVAADDAWLVTGNDYERFTFEIATSGAKSMSIQANGGDGYIDLEWMQDDFDTLAGYNVYRSTSMNGAYTKINGTVIAGNFNHYTDRNVEAGVTYYYYFTVVKTDQSESSPSGVAAVASRDTTPPTIEHVAITSAAQSNNLSVVAYVYDNISVQQVKVYYRVNGETEYRYAEMHRVGDKYTGVIPADAVTAAGVEYYIMANDGTLEGYCGSAKSPYTIQTYPVYTVKVRVVEGGVIYVSQIKSKEGVRIRVSVVADSGYTFLAGSLQYISSEGVVFISDNEFEMPAMDVEINATFLVASTYELGDVNRDGRIDAADAILLLRYDAGLTSFDREQLLLADVDRNGTIDVRDATKVLQSDIAV